MKISKQRPHLKWSREARRENSHTRVIQRTLLAPTGSDTILPPQQEEEKIPSCPVTALPVRDCHNSVKSHGTSQLSVSFNRLFIYNSPSQVHNKAFLSHVSLEFHMVHHKTTCPKLKFFVRPKLKFFVLPK